MGEAGTQASRTHGFTTVDNSSLENVLPDVFTIPPFSALEKRLRKRILRYLALLNTEITEAHEHLLDEPEWEALHEHCVAIHLWAGFVVGMTKVAVDVVVERDEGVPTPQMGTLKAEPAANVPSAGERGKA